MASQTWQELVEFHSTVWEIETTGWEIQEKQKFWKAEMADRSRATDGKSVCFRWLQPHTSAMLYFKTDIRSNSQSLLLCLNILSESLFSSFWIKMFTNSIQIASIHVLGLRQQDKRTPCFKSFKEQGFEFTFLWEVSVRITSGLVRKTTGWHLLLEHAQ